MKIKKRDLNKLEKAIDMMNEAMKSINEYCEGANLFFNGSAGLIVYLHTIPYAWDNEEEWYNSSIDWYKDIHHADAGGY